MPEAEEDAQFRATVPRGSGAIDAEEFWKRYKTERGKKSFSRGH